MGNVLEEMRDEMPGRFKWLNVFLSAKMAIPSLYFSIAIQAVFVGTLF